jgi:hypothetical protein
MIVNIAELKQPEKMLKFVHSGALTTITAQQVGLLPPLQKMLPLPPGV